MWRNLGEAVERVVARHRSHLRDLPQPAISGLAAPTTSPDLQQVGDAQAGLRTGPFADRVRQRHAAVHDLRAEGHDLRAIARILGLARNTVRRFARATTPQELLVNTSTGRRPRLLDAYAPYLAQRWNQGCTNAERLCQELRERGYQGKSRTVRDYVRTWRSANQAASAPPSPPSVRSATGWLMRNPAHLSADEQRQLDTLALACPALAAVREHVTAFAAMMLNRQRQRLEAWMNAVEADDLPELHSFVTGLRRDFDAARAGLTLRHSSGPVEGHVNRIKMLKRQMDGRANTDLLRKRTLLAD